MFTSNRIFPLLLAFCSGALAEEASLSLHSTVSGNQEQPRVIYIVPWQQPESAEFDYELQNSIAAELFSQVDRYEFNRALAYQALLSEQTPGEVAISSTDKNSNTDQ